LSKTIKVRKINKSFVITIPRQFAEIVGIDTNSNVEIEKKDTFKVKLCQEAKNE
jgi:antitoxin component of MazEF toxin-antitoxin module